MLGTLTSSSLAFCSLLTPNFSECSPYSRQSFSISSIIKRYVQRFQVAEAIARAEVVECASSEWRILCIKASLVHVPPLAPTPSDHPKLVAPRWRISKQAWRISLFFVVCQSALNYSVKNSVKSPPGPSCSCSCCCSGKQTLQRLGRFAFDLLCSTRS